MGSDDEDVSTGALPTEALAPSGSGWLTQVIANFNLPTILAGPAGAAISRLIGGAVDIPAAWLDQKAQAIKDRTTAKTEMSKAVTQQAIREVQSDPDLPRRAAESLIAREYRSQTNKEAVAEKTLKLLSDQSSGGPNTTSSSAGAETSRPAEPSADWMNIFERYAADAGSDRLQETWARILAGQIRQPETFSIKTLRLISEMDQRTALEFEKAVAHVVNDLFIPKFEPPLLAQETAASLEEAGLITGTGAFGSTLTFEGNAALSYENHAIILVVQPDAKLSMAVFPLTRAGKEVLKLVRRPFPLAAAKLFAERVAKEQLTQIVFGPIVAQVPADDLSKNVTVGPPTILWQKPSP